MLSTRNLLLCIALVLLASAVYADSEASQYHDCESCVEAGWGWSWSKSQCGGYLNTNCDPDSAEALDEEEDEDFNQQATASSNQQQQQQQQQHDQDEEDTPTRVPDPAPIPSDPLPWVNTPETTRLWELANKGDLQNLAQWAYRQPEIVHLRSEDGRGALFWANEYEKHDMIKFLLERGADPDATDAMGNKPSDLLPAGSKKRK